MKEDTIWLAESLARLAKSAEVLAANIIKRMEEQEIERARRFKEIWGEQDNECS